MYFKNLHLCAKLYCCALFSRSYFNILSKLGDKINTVWPRMALQNLAQKSVSRKRTTYPQILGYANEDIENTGLFVDVTIAVGNVTIPANKLILSCCSKVFEKMFKTEMKERYESTINMTGSMDELSARALIDFIYTGVVIISNDNVLRLLAAADYLQMEEVKQFCVDFLESILTPDNCHAILMSANRFQLESLQKQIYEMISLKFDAFIETEDFKLFAKTDLISCLTKLNKHQVNESSIFTAIVTWTNYDKQNRKDAFLEIFRLINLEELTPAFLQNVVAFEDLVRQNLDCSNIVMTALVKSLTKSLADPDLNVSKILSIGGTYTPGKVIEVFNRDNQPAVIYPDAPSRIDDGWALKLHDFVYCIGGTTEILSHGTRKFGVLKKVFRFKVNACQIDYDEVSSMNSARMLFSAAVFNDTIVVTGGRDETPRILQTTECYIPQFNEWRLIATPKSQKLCHVLVSCKECLYNIGGVGENGFSSAVERLRGLKEEWEFAPPMHEKRLGLAAVACNDCIYAIGGRSGDSRESYLKTVEKYDATVNRWSFVEEMKFYRAGHFACVLNGKIFVIGGKDADGTIVREIEVYDPNTNTWSVVGRTAKLYNHSLVVV